MNDVCIAKAIENFRQHINVGFASVVCAYGGYSEAMGNRPKEVVEKFDDYFHDWAQALWEFFVERSLCSASESLVIYGSGSDYETAAHSRAFFREIEASHEIGCVEIDHATDKLTGSSVSLSEYVFEGFVTTAGNWYEIKPPFDHVLLLGKKDSIGSHKEIVVPLEQIKWVVNGI